VISALAIRWGARHPASGAAPPKRQPEKEANVSSEFNEQLPIEYGYCHCGCGRKTSLSRFTDPKRGYVKGEPMRFMQGHGSRRPLADRLWSRVDKRGPDECWEWMGGHNGHGYASIGITSNSRIYVHRLAYELEVGPIPDGLEIDHLCSNRLCVNPAHLEPVTRQENQRRYAETVTHCKHGHPFDEANTYRQPITGKRECRRCDAIRHQCYRRVGGV
jgi:hypothetical protein